MQFLKRIISETMIREHSVRPIGKEATAEKLTFFKIHLYKSRYK